MNEMYPCCTDGAAVLNTDIHGCEMTVNTKKKTEAKFSISSLLYERLTPAPICLAHKYTWEENGDMTSEKNPHVTVS